MAELGSKVDNSRLFTKLKKRSMSKTEMRCFKYKKKSNSKKTRSNACKGVSWHYRGKMRNLKRKLKK